MKRLLPIYVAVIFTGHFLFAGDLFFSEYIEGSSYNKAIEIYNPTGEPVDLSQYVVKQANNGSGWGAYTPTGGSPTEDTRYVLPLSGTLNAGDVYVIYHNSAADQIKDVGDIGFSYNSTPNGGDGDNVVNFNGDDALGLFKNGVLIDVIGAPMTDPGTGWAVAGVSDATAEHTLVRKSTISEGNTNWTASAGTTADDSEWIVYPQNTFTYIGSHVWEGAGNVAPIARAGSDKVARFGETVILDGSASNDPDGSIISYAWTQVAGTSVTLSATDQAVVSFTAPDVVSEFAFELVVTDNEAAVGKDTITVYVDPSQIIISEYVEGSSYNKYIEIYNSSELTVDLAAEGYDLRKVTDGNGTFSETFSNWEDFSQLASGATIVLGNSQATIYPNVDITNNNVINFNGNDAVGLFRNGLLVDVIGDPYSDELIIENMTLRRKNTVMYGGSTYDPDEWEEYETDNVDNLGQHSTNPNAPAISNISVAQTFVTSAMEIEISARIVPVEGNEVSVALIRYGTGGSFPNESEMWQDEGDIWMGMIPPQAAYTKLNYKIVATDNQNNSGESAAESILIADAELTDIADIRADKANYIGNLVTIKGIVTIGSGILDTRMTKAYLQDNSGRGINLFDYSLISGINRGDELRLVGTVEEYNSVLELTEFNFETVSTDNDLPEATSIGISEANGLEYEGTLVKFQGVISDTAVVGGGVSVYVKLDDDSTTVRIWESTGIDFSNINIGSAYWFQGVINPYYDNFQLLVGYQEDICAVTGIENQTAIATKFELEPAYPNPFNPTTKISWHLDRTGEFELATFNMLGQKVDVISKSFGPAGAYTVNWNASQLPSGVYFIQLESHGRHMTQKVLLLK